MNDEEIRIYDKREVLMNGEIGNVTVRLFKRHDRYETSAIAYMHDILPADERNRLKRLWDDICEFLISRSEGSSKTK